jgi:hypothetical protein
MLAVVAHLALVDADRFATVVAVFGEHGVEAVQTVWLAVSHNVPEVERTKNSKNG